MKHSMCGADRQTLSAIATVVTHSRIVVSRPAHYTSFPNGYDQVDIKILEWIRRVPQEIDPAAATHCRAS
ncbi:MAG TPA: hypothetical protein VGU90_04535 [Terriglobales bacterium]|jgi:hypothetical protein|nr:hypothetical protein [Terriglobales bacterium]